MSDNFDEQAYLSRNPDVAQAVKQGQFASGRDHYHKCGQFEQRKGAPLQMAPVFTAEATFPFPPEHLRFRVHGGHDLEGYIKVGKTVASDLFHAIDSGWVQVPEHASVLDFGCGPGRVICWMQQQREGWQSHGTDIDAEAIGWAQANLADMATFDCNETLPPLGYPTGAFDLVYSISIFTHLPEDMQTQWLAELARVSRTGAWLVLTTHSEELLPDREKMPDSGFLYVATGGTDGLPEFYQNSFQTKAYIEREWSKHFAIERIERRGLANHQDLIVCRKR